MTTIKNIAIFVIIGAVLVLAYIFFIKKTPNQASLVSVQNTPIANVTNSTNQNSVVTGDFLSLLLSVKSIKLDDSIFSDEAFKSLSDSSITDLTPDSTEGRPNPFAPFGSNTGVVGGNGTTTLPGANTNALLPGTNTNPLGPSVTPITPPAPITPAQKTN